MAIHEALGKDGMSSDETDREDSGVARGPTMRVRRIRRHWIDEKISSLWNAVESYYNPFKLSGAPKSGTKPLPRIYAPLHANHLREPPNGLPRNFYNDMYWASLTSVRRRQLQPAPAMPIPALVRWFRQLTPCHLITSAQPVKRGGY
jgi:hypothetical protein